MKLVFDTERDPQNKREISKFINLPSDGSVFTNYTGQYHHHKFNTTRLWHRFAQKEQARLSEYAAFALARHICSKSQ